MRSNLHSLTQLAVTLSSLLALMPGSASARGLHARCEIVPDTWTPSLNQVKEYIETSEPRATTNQQILTKTSENLADVRDAELFIVYVQLMQALTPQERTNLFSEQKRWLSTREARSRAAVVSKGGTLEQLEYSSSYRSITERRLSELQQRLQKKNCLR